jgi:(2R)-3-sulfolactate dehydrogenase (NADP+)
MEAGIVAFVKDVEARTEVLNGAGVRMTRRFSLEEATDLAARAVRAAGASSDAAESLAQATVSANAHGKGSSGFSHLMDYLAALRAGRLIGDAEPLVTSPAPAAIHCDARGGIAQLGFDRSFEDLRRRAETFGIALFVQKGSYTTGELGYYPRRLVEVGLVAFAATSGPALMTVAGAKTPVYCTNPIAFAAPLDKGPPLLIDQASSATAFVELRRYAERGEALPSGWAVDGEGQPTTDPHAALRGALLAFGGARGANIALMVEVMAAGLANANWALDAPSFTSGNRSPGAGLLVIAITPALLAPDFPQRLRLQLDRLTKLGVHIPGRRVALTEIELPDALAAEIERAGAP